MVSEMNAAYAQRNYAENLRYDCSSHRSRCEEADTAERLVPQLFSKLTQTLLNCLRLGD